MGQIKSREKSPPFRLVIFPVDAVNMSASPRWKDHQEFNQIHVNINNICKHPFPLINAWFSPNFAQILTILRPSWLAFLTSKASIPSTRCLMASWWYWRRENLNRKPWFLTTKYMVFSWFFSLNQSNELHNIYGIFIIRTYTNVYERINHMVTYQMKSTSPMVDFLRFLNQQTDGI